MQIFFERIISVLGILTALSSMPVAMAKETQQLTSVKLVVPYPAGGNADSLARVFADEMSKEMNKNFVVENKGGAAGAIGAQQVARSKADGATLLLAPAGVMTITPFLRQVNYDPFTDFEPIAKLSESIGIVAVRKDFPGSTLKDLIEYDRQNPGKITYGSAGQGTLTHLQALILAKKLGITALHVPYKGSVEALNDLLGGRIDYQYDSVALSNVVNGNLKALAIPDSLKHAELKNVPTFSQQGIDLKTTSWFGVFAPAGTPQTLIDEYALAAQKVMNKPGMEERLLQFGQIPTYLNTKDFIRQSNDDILLYENLIKENNIRLN